jgi:hypothetical protein
MGLDDEIKYLEATAETNEQAQIMSLAPQGTCNGCSGTLRFLVQAFVSVGDARAEALALPQNALRSWNAIGADARAEARAYLKRSSLLVRAALEFLYD